MVEIVLDDALPVVAPDQGYDRVKVWLSVSPRDLVGGTVDYAASMTVLPYRVVGGVIDDAPESMRRVVNIGSVAEAVASGAPEGQAAAGILTILQQSLKGMKPA